MFVDVKYLFDIEQKIHIQNFLIHRILIQNQGRQYTNFSFSYSSILAVRTLIYPQFPFHWPAILVFYRGLESMVTHSNALDLAVAITAP